MPSYILSIVGAVPERELSLPAPPVELARRLAQATGLPTTTLDAIAARADQDGDRTVFDTRLVVELTAELKALDTALEARLDAEGFLKGAPRGPNHFNLRQRMRAALKLLELAAQSNSAAEVQA